MRLLRQEKAFVDGNTHSKFSDGHFSLVTIIDPHILGNEYSFMENYLYSERHHIELKERLKCVLHRTLRKDVSEYIKYTNREAMTVAFNPTPAEEELYREVSAYIQDVSKLPLPPVIVR